jgi:sphingolipid delta-4 desaturase
MGSNLSAPTDYEWSYTDEPHASRRKEILAKYPQIRELFGHDTNIKYVCMWWVVTQLLLAWLLKDSNWGTILVVAYFYGGFASQALFLGMHEISHNLAFQKPLYNKLFGCLSNIATIVPHFSMFQKYHLEHHQYQGVDSIDTDVPTVWEGRFFTNAFLKLLWVTFQPFFYAFRPLYIKPRDPGFWEAINWTLTIAVDILVMYYFGWKSFWYLGFSTIFAGGLHPTAGHFISEHYVWIKGQETYSYYGPLNLVAFNVGYHNEHHDFPRIPGSKLPQLRAICPEYYDSLPSHNSWVKVLYDYIMDPTVGPFSRIKRKQKVIEKKED